MEDNRVEESLDSSKNRFEALESLRRAAWQRFDRRRDFEWKVCLALWTALAVLTGSLLTGKIAVASNGSSVSWVTILAALAGGMSVAILHTIFVHGIAIRNAQNRDDEREIESEMRALLSLKPLEKHPPPFPIRELDYSHILQIGITTVLALTTIVAVWVSQVGHSDSQETVTARASRQVFTCYSTGGTSTP